MLENSPPLNHSDQHYRNRDEQQQMNVTVQHSSGRESKSPQDQQDNEDRPQHKASSDENQNTSIAH